MREVAGKIDGKRPRTERRDGGDKRQMEILMQLTCNNNRAQNTRVDLGRAEKEQLRRKMAERDEVGEECHVIHSVSRIAREKQLRELCY